MKRTGPCPRCKTAERAKGCTYCKKCHTEKVIAWQKSDPEGYAKKRAAFREKNKHNAAASQRYINYRIRQDKFDAMLSAQKGLCAICFGKFGSRGPYVDHDHLRGNVRGLLCARCNTGLGMFGDDQERMLAAIEYLKRTSGSCGH